MHYKDGKKLNDFMITLRAELSKKRISRSIAYCRIPKNLQQINKEIRDQKKMYTKSNKEPETNKEITNNNEVSKYISILKKTLNVQDDHNTNKVNRSLVVIDIKDEQHECNERDSREEIFAIRVDAKKKSKPKINTQIETREARNEYRKKIEQIGSLLKTEKNKHLVQIRKLMKRQKVNLTQTFLETNAIFNFKQAISKNNNAIST